MNLTYSWLLTCKTSLGGEVKKYWIPTSTIDDKHELISKGSGECLYAAQQK